MEACRNERRDDTGVSLSQNVSAQLDKHCLGRCLVFFHVIFTADLWGQERLRAQDDPTFKVWRVCERRFASLCGCAPLCQRGSPDWMNGASTWKKVDKESPGSWQRAACHCEIRSRSHVLYRYCIALPKHPAERYVFAFHLAS